MQNGAVHMTKESYFEMCEMLGTEPKEEDIPVELDDFPLEVQQALNVYRMLRDEWDAMSGTYLGKSLIGITEIMDATEIDLAERKLTITLIRMIDSVRQEQINTKKANEKPAK